MGYRRSIGSAVLVSLCFLWAHPNVALAQVQQQPIQPVRDLTVSDIFVSPDLGYVTDTSQSNNSSVMHAPMIIHIQEAHTNYEGQQHLVAILTHLIERYHLKLIMVEGGQGDVSLSYMRTYGSLEKRKQVAEKYLKTGIISGEEYLDVTSEYPLILWGVEQRDLYQQNLDAFMTADDLKASATPTLASVRQTVESLKPFLSDQDLDNLQAQTKAFQQETLGLADYADALAHLAQRHGITEGAYPSLRHFREVHQLERDMDLAQVQHEQQAFMKTLSLRVDEATFTQLITKAKAIKEGQVTREAFYATLEALAATSRLPLAEYPHLAGYMTYLKQRAAIAPTALSDELKVLATTLQDQLVSTPERRQLQTIERQVLLVENLVNLRLSPSEYQELQALGFAGVCAGWKSFLDAQAARHGLSSPTAERLNELDLALPKLARFYTAASERDQALVANAVAKLRQTQEPIAVLITGGFHSSKITQLLKDAQISTVVIAPKITQATNEQLYRAVLRYKSGHGSFEEVMAVAGTPATAAGAQPEPAAVTLATRRPPEAQ